MGKKSCRLCVCLSVCVWVPTQRDVLKSAASKTNDSEWYVGYLPVEITEILWAVKCFIKGCSSVNYRLPGDRLCPVSRVIMCQWLKLHFFSPGTVCWDPVKYTLKFQCLAWFGKNSQVDSASASGCSQTDKHLTSVVQKSKQRKTGASLNWIGIRL